MIFDFSNFIFNLKVNAKIRHQKWNFYSKNHEDNFDERYHQNCLLKIMFNHKSIVTLLKLSLKSILFYLMFLRHYE
jgi:hypothetical protein